MRSINQNCVTNLSPKMLHKVVPKHDSVVVKVASLVRYTSRVRLPDGALISRLFIPCGWKMGRHSGGRGGCCLGRLSVLTVKPFPPAITFDFFFLILFLCAW